MKGQSRTCNQKPGQTNPPFVDEVAKQIQKAEGMELAGTRMPAKKTTRAADELLMASCNSARISRQKFDESGNVRQS